MKVIFFDFTTMVGGATKGSIYLLKRLDNKGIDVSITDVYGNCDEHIKDVRDANISLKILKPQKNNTVIGNHDNKLKRILVIMRQFPSFLSIIINLFNHIKSEKPNFVLVNNEKSLFFLALLKRFLGFKIIIYYRGEANKNQMTKRFVKMINLYVDIKYCHSKKAIINMRNYGVLGDIIYLPNCVDSEFISKFNNIKKIGNDITILLNAGRVVEEKGFHTAIEALGILRNEGYKVNLILPGLIVDNSYKEHLNSVAHKYNVVKFINFIGWVDNVTELLASVDYMILPSYTEGFPRSIIEAMLLRIPVCATPVGGIPEAIFDKKTGCIFNVNDPQALAKCLKMMIESPLKTQEIVENAYNFAIENFDQEKNTQLFLENLG